VHEESVRRQGKADVHRAVEKDIRPSQWKHAIPADLPTNELFLDFARPQTFIEQIALEARAGNSVLVTMPAFNSIHRKFKNQFQQRSARVVDAAPLISEILRQEPAAVIRILDAREVRWPEN
jgi:hypothetical protein